MIAVDAASGACLGLVGGQLWTRDGVNPIPHRERPPAERESMRWLDAAAQAKQVLQPAAMVTVVDDRESDIYAKWASVPEPGFHMLTRAMQDRRLATGGMLFAAADAFPAAGKRSIDLRPHEPGQARRKAVVEVRCGGVELCRPQQEDRSLPRTVRLRLIEVREVDPPADVEPLPLAFARARLAAADHARDRRCGRGMADRRLVPASLGHRANAPGTEIPGTATGRQPGDDGEAPGEAEGGGGQGGLHRHPVDARA
jgi:hypothetical protein